jgi:hypothetical protein
LAGYCLPARRNVTLLRVVMGAFIKTGILLSSGLPSEDLAVARWLLPWLRVGGTGAAWR